MSESRSKTLQVRVTPREKRTMEKIGERDDRTVSEMLYEFVRIEVEQNTAAPVEVEDDSWLD